MNPYECGECGLVEYDETECSPTPPGRVCGTCGSAVARCWGSR